MLLLRRLGIRPIYTAAASRRFTTNVQPCAANISACLSQRLSIIRQPGAKRLGTRFACSRMLETRRWLIATKSPNNSNREDRKAALQQKAQNAKKVITKIIPTHENIYTIPNFLTFTRLASAPYIGYLIMHQDYQLALGIFALAGFTDLLDGFIARRYNLKTVVGSIIDPAADKALMTVMTVTLAADNVLPLPLAAIILGRDAGLVLAAFYYRYISLPEPKTLVRYFDFSIPSAEVRPTMISKVNTALQLLLMGLSLTSTALTWPPAVYMSALHWLVGGTTIWSGASYIFSKDAVRILNRD
ncbi:hypothetical protein VTP01DRAFT_10914 [Rhizomucor pusillus]|uniref:uncharacterized protein n=1 Tax=Rhizomucor pusillus TaxID=4840 RepID=UPI0037431439